MENWLEMMWALKLLEEKLPSMNWFNISANQKIIALAQSTHHWICLIQHAYTLNQQQKGKSLPVNHQSLLFSYSFILKMQTDLIYHVIPPG